MKLIHIHGVWPLYTNTFLLITAAGHAVVVDPAAEAETYLAQLKENNATLTDIFLTHGHYDHVGSVAALKKATGAKVHMDLADAKGDQMYPLTPDLIDAPWPAGNSEYQVDELTFRIWHTPGHTPGGVVIACGDRLFSGDTLFAGSCGRVDLPGGSPAEMQRSLALVADLPLPDVQAAISLLSQAKGLHDELEAVYNPHVDFARVYALANSHALRLFKEN